MSRGMRDAGSEPVWRQPVRDPVPGRGSARDLVYMCRVLMTGYEPVWRQPGRDPVPGRGSARDLVYMYHVANIYRLHGGPFI